LFPGIFRHAKTGATAAPFGLRELLVSSTLLHFHGFFSRMVFPARVAECHDPWVYLTDIFAYNPYKSQG